MFRLFWTWFLNRTNSRTVAGEESILVVEVTPWLGMHGYPNNFGTRRRDG